MNGTLLRTLEKHVANATGGTCEIVEHKPNGYQMTITIRTGGALLSALGTTTINVARELHDRLQKAEAMLAETITWHDAAVKLPDDETTVLVQSPEGSEPVWPGYHDERGWHWSDNPEHCIAVTAWADMPAGVAP